MSNALLMTGKELPAYRFDEPMTVSEQIIARGDVSGNACTLSVAKHEGDHLFIASVNGVRVAISGKQLIGSAASL
jgi:hypothetical protein